MDASCKAQQDLSTLVAIVNGQGLLGFDGVCLQCCHALFVQLVHLRGKGRAPSQAAHCRLNCHQPLGILRKPPGHTCGLLRRVSCMTPSGMALICCAAWR